MIIYKYNIPIMDDFYIEMPINAEILSFQEQSGKFYIWAAHEKDSQTEMRRFSMIGTGSEFDKKSIKKYIGTIQTTPNHWNVIFVWHLFEMI